MHKQICLPSKTCGSEWKLRGLTTEGTLMLPSAIRTCHQRSQNNSAPLSDSPGTKGAVGLDIFSWVHEEPPAAGFSMLCQRLCRAEAGRGRRAGRRARQAGALWTLIHSSLPRSVPWWEGSSPGCCRRELAWQQGWGCCWSMAGGWPIAGRLPSARGPSCAGQPRWPCGYSGSRRWGGRRAPWGLEHSKNTVDPLEEEKQQAPIIVHTLVSGEAQKEGKSLGPGRGKLNLFGFRHHREHRCSKPQDPVDIPKDYQSTREAQSPPAPSCVVLCQDLGYSEP